MSMFLKMNRREALAATGATALSLGLSSLVPAMAATKLKQGYQINMWGMPTYYLIKSGVLQKRGIEVEEFAVASGNQTMQQMVARQVDMGTYAGPSFVLGHDAGDIVAIAVIEDVGKTAQVMGRKDLNLKSVADLKGKKVANQVGSSTGNIFSDQIAPKAGLKKGDFEEVRMNTNDQAAALAAKTVDAMVTVEPYNAIAEAEGYANPLQGGDFYSFDKMPVFMAATPEFVDKNPDAIVAYLKAWLDVGKEFKQSPDKVQKVIYDYYTSKGYKMSMDVFKTAMSRVQVDPGFPSDLQPYLEKHAEILIREKKIKKVPDWKKALRPDFMQKARASA